MRTKITRTGVGVATHEYAVTDVYGSGLLPMQVSPEAGVTYKINGRVSPEAPWVEIRAANTDSFVEAFSYCPFIQLEITAGTGTATLWIAG